MNQENKKVNIIAWVSAIVAITMVKCVKFIVPVCAGMVETAAGKQIPMKCHYTSQVIMLLGVLLLVNAIVCGVTKQGLACGIMGIALSAVAIIVFNDSIGIGICMKPEMACHATAPVVKVCATVEIIVSAIMCALSAKRA